MRYNFFCFFLCLFCISCQDYTPKPRGYFRIEPGLPQYTPLSLESLPYTFDISRLATVELPPESEPAGWMRIVYPALGAKIYGTYLPITPATLSVAEEESRSLVSRQARQAVSVTEKAYSNPEQHVYGSLFLLEGEVASPVQFMLTDSLSRFFRGALYYDCKLNPDSLAPVTHYLQADIMEMIQTFRWKKTCP